MTKKPTKRNKDDNIFISFEILGTLKRTHKNAIRGHRNGVYIHIYVCVCSCAEEKSLQYRKHRKYKTINSEKKEIIA